MWPPFILEPSSPEIRPFSQRIDSKSSPMSIDGGTDERVEKGVRILSLDSGGPGTYSQLLIIREYMVRLANDLGIDEGDVYPADYFDLMGGVGFGGLVAILLGHLWMNVDEAIDALLKVALAIFPGNPHPESDQEARTSQLSESVKSILQTRGIPSDRRMQDISEESVGCKVALYAATAANLSHPIVLRNYRSRRPSLNPTILEAICATMTTPSLFSPIKIGPLGRQQTFIGGPHGGNNPTRELLKEASAIFGKEKLVTQILSLGCGHSHISSMERNANIEGCRSIHEMAVDCDAVAKELSTRLCDMAAYLRLNVDRGMENLLMSEWAELGPIETHTGAYVDTAEISGFIEASLRSLQGGIGTVTLGEINHPRAAKDVQNKLDKQKEDLERTSGSVKDYEDSRVLDRLKPVDAPSYHESRSCMKDTRTLILDHIVTWAKTPSVNNTPSNVPAPKNIFWLYGSPGLGKTSIANSLCHRLHKTGNLGGSFFCRRDDPVLCDPNRVLPTLLHKIACMWSPYRDLVVQALRGDPNLNPDWTGCALLLEHLYPLQRHPQSPFTVVIDALDESGDPRTRVPLLKCFSEVCTRVDWLKIIVTSRPEHDIGCFFQKLDIVGHDLSRDDQAHQDIRLFTRYRMDLLAKQYHLPNEWPGEPRIEEITERSGGLFIFVETLYQFLDDPNPELLLTQVLSRSLGEANVELHKLYSTAIATRIGRCKEDFRLFVQALVAVATHRSLPDRTLASLIGLEPRVISSWVDSLSSLLYRDVSENGGIRARHLSVIDFLIDPACPPEFRVDIQEANAQLGHRCIIIMMKELDFNICKLETSCVLNAEIQDLDDRVRERISDALGYSCMHWFSHLCSGSSPASKSLSELLGTFLTGTHLLYWLEVLSLMGKVPVAILALRLMKTCFKKFEARHQIAVEDALRFVLAFLTPISTSAAHIYISGLPFMPVECGLWEHVHISFPELINVCEGRMKYWPAPWGVWPGHTSTIHSVAYSPDGRNIVSASRDKTIRIWDAETGAAVGEPLKGHGDEVMSAAYSPDGRNIISGSGDRTIRIWDAETGAAVGEPLEVHGDGIDSVAYSPNGRNFISVSREGTIRIWDAQTKEVVREPLKEHTGRVHSAAYSPDGQNIVTGHGDSIIRIWDAETWEPVREPLKGHTGPVRSVAYSLDGQNIVSGSDDSTILIWDAEIGAAVGEPLRGHNGRVNRVAYLSHGRNIVSASSDNTLRIWDVQTRAAVGEPLSGHSLGISTVACSLDGRDIIFSSGDHTIRICDAKTREALGEPLNGHTESVIIVAYSPNGKNIVSGSHDNTIRIWDVQTGVAVGKPLKGHTGSVISVAYSPDGQNFVSGSLDNTIRIWDAKTGAVVGKSLKGHTGEVYSVAYSPDGRSIISASSDSTIRLWDAQTRAMVGEPLMGHTGEVYSVAYSPDGQSIVSGSSDNTVRIWDAGTGAAVRGPLKGHTGCIHSVIYSPDGQNIVSGCGDGTIRIWDAETGLLVRELLKGYIGEVYSVAYSPDGRNVISGCGDCTIRTWDTETGEQVRGPLVGHAGGVYSVAYSPDGQNVLSGSGDNTIRLWEAQTNMEEDGRGVFSESRNVSNGHLRLNTLSGLPIPTTMLESNGWVRGTEGLLFWVPEDCRNGLTSSAIMSISTSTYHRPVRIDLTRFQYGTSWIKIRGSNVGGEL